MAFQQFQKDDKNGSQWANAVNRATNKATQNYADDAVQQQASQQAYQRVMNQAAKQATAYRATQQTFNNVDDVDDTTATNSVQNNRQAQKTCPPGQANVDDCGR
jgi:hypothetical protein